jgi:hypothetical protein
MTALASTVNKGLFHTGWAIVALTEGLSQPLVLMSTWMRYHNVLLKMQVESQHICMMAPNLCSTLPRTVRTRRVECRTLKRQEYTSWIPEKSN